MNKTIHRFLFPERGDHWKWLVLFIICIPVGHLLSGIFKTEYINVIILFPLFGMAYSNIREAQICNIEEDYKSKYSNLKLTFRRNMGIIGMFLPALSFTAVYFSDMLFWVVYGFLTLISAYFMFLAVIVSKIFIVIGIVYLFVYYILAGLMMGSTPVGITFIFSLILLPHSVAEVILMKRVLLDQALNGNEVALKTANRV